MGLTSSGDDDNDTTLSQIPPASTSVKTHSKIPFRLATLQAFTVPRRRGEASDHQVLPNDLQALQNPIHSFAFSAFLLTRFFVCLDSAAYLKGPLFFVPPLFFFNGQVSKERKATTANS